MQIASPTWRFVPENLDAADLEALESLFHSLRDRDIHTVKELEAWLEDESELHARIAAEKARRYIAKTCHTDDETARDRYLTMERDVMPSVQILADVLDTKLLESEFIGDLPVARYEVAIRSRRSAKEIFREENTQLQADEAALKTRQQALMGSLTVDFNGEEHTPQQMAPYALDQDRGLRERAYRATLATRRETWAELNEIYSELIALRTKMAANAGYGSYTPFRFKQLSRFDYSETLCEQFHEAVAEVVVPAVRRLDERRRQKLGVDTLRPWDLEVNLEGRKPFRPFETDEELQSLVTKIFTAVDPRFASEFGILQREKLLDLMSRKGKAPGGYQYTLEDVRLPFIFCNSVGTHSDVQTLLHEGGHAFHSILSRDDKLIAYRHSPIEFAETASMSMELMGLEELAGVYGEEEAGRTRGEHLEGLLRILPWIACIDAFQHWIYKHPDNTREERDAHWLTIMDRFKPGIDYSGLEDARKSMWTAQGHLYNHAFYYIEYGIAQIAALQIWQAYRQDKAKAVEAYRNGLQLGGSRPLPELFAAAGVSFDVSSEILGRLVADVESLI